jgi:hypothetical protein
MPPLRPKQVEWVKALQTIHVLQLTTAVLFVALGVDQLVATALESLATTTIGLNNRRLQPVKTEVLKCKPGTCLVGRTGNTLPPVLLVEDHRASRCLADESRMALLTDIDDGRVANQKPTLIGNHPDPPNQGILLLPDALVPFVLVFQYRGAAAPHVPADREALHPSPVLGVNELRHRFLGERGQLDRQHFIVTFDGKAHNGTKCHDPLLSPVVGVPPTGLRSRISRPDEPPRVGCFF